MTATGVALPVAPDAAERLAEELLAHGLEPDEVVAVLPHLPVQPETADTVVAIIRAAGIGGFDQPARTIPSRSAPAR